MTKYYMVGNIPVRVTFRQVGDITAPSCAEFWDAQQKILKINNLLLSEIDDGEDVEEIDKNKFNDLIL